MMAGTRVDQGPSRSYFVLDGQGRGLAYNAFIDTARAHNLDPKYVVADGGYGIGLRVKRISFHYRIAFVSPEYEQALTHDYKALRVSFPIGSRKLARQGRQQRPDTQKGHILVEVGPAAQWPRWRGW